MIQSPPPTPSPFRCAPGLLLRRSRSRGYHRRSALRRWCLHVLPRGLVRVRQSVSFRWTQRERGEARITTLKGHEFMRLFLQHVLPRGFRRVRHFGYLSATAKERYERLRSLLRAGAIVLILPEKTTVCCESCGKAMTFLAAIRHPHRARPPPPIAEPTLS